MKSQRNGSIDYLRGIAALMVCFCHLRLALPEFMRDGAKTYGELGVQVFFVVSGYIIPYSLFRGGYRLADFGRFWLKRILRLQPALVAALGLTFVLSVAAAMAKGQPSTAQASTFLKTAFYLGIPEENPVFWTLIVEVKYYFFVAVLFPVLFSNHHWIRRTAFVAATSLAIWGTPYVDWWKHLPFFLMGFSGCYVATRQSGWWEFAGLMALALIAASVNATVPQIIAGLATSAVILLPLSGKWKVAGLYGAISYSLYLVHFPVGVKFLNLTLPYVHGWLPRLMLGLAALGVCTLVAYGLYVLVEKPSSAWSQKVRLCGAKQRVVPPASGWAGTPEPSVKPPVSAQARPIS
jgi:peptidoglycan/LPS O-acetylase OafA/YrhL